MNTTWVQFFIDHQTLTVAAGALIVFAAIALWHAGKAVAHALRQAEPADLLTYVAAAIATAVATQGMWLVFRDVLHIEVVLRILTFAFLELATLTSAVRARRNISDKNLGTAGADGIAVWTLTGTSAVLSSMHAASPTAAVLRLAAPLVAAWLWERGLHVERQRTTGRNGIHWRLTPERILVRLGLAEPTDRTAGQADADRRLTRLALAAQRARTTTGRRQTWALGRLDTAMRRAIEHTALATDPVQQEHLRVTLASLAGTGTLLTLEGRAPWLGTPDVPQVHVPRGTPPMNPGNTRAVPDPREHQEQANPGTTLTPDPHPVSQEHQGQEQMGEPGTPITPPSPDEGPHPEFADKTDDDIVSELLTHKFLPPIRAIKKTYSLGTSRATELQALARSHQNQNLTLEEIKINKLEPQTTPTHLPEPQTEDHLEHTPMQQS